MKAQASKPKASKSTPKPEASLSNCSITGVHWDAKAIEAIDKIAEAIVRNADALKENAIACQKMVAVFRSQAIHLDPMVSLSGSGIELFGNVIRPGSADDE